MGATSPDNIFFPDLTGKYNYVGDMAQLASTTQAALVRRSWYYVGSDEDRLALAAPELRDGITWEDPSTGRMWTRRAGAWVEKDLVRSLGRIAPVTTGAQNNIEGTMTKVTGATLNVTLSAPTQLRIYASLTTYSSNASDVINVALLNGDAVVSQMTTPPNSSSSIAATGRVQIFITEVLLPAGSHALSIGVQRVAGPGKISIAPSAQTPTTFSIDRIG